MFNYFGSKYWVAKKYPQPVHDKIVEPFAGSAQYSLVHYAKEVHINEKDTRIYNIWKYLQKSTPEDILNLYIPEPSEEIRHEIPEARDLIALAMNRGTSKPQRVAGSWPQLPGCWRRKKEIIAGNLFKIKHWSITNRDYSELLNCDATWFIDPPYQNIKGYIHTITDYPALGAWCKSREGQVLVCETEGADWMPFEFFRKSKTMRGKRNEVIWDSTINGR